MAQGHMPQCCRCITALALSIIACCLQKAAFSLSPLFLPSQEPLCLTAEGSSDHTSEQQPAIALKCRDMVIWHGAIHLAMN